MSDFYYERLLAEAKDDEPAPIWQVVYTIVVLVLMFSVLMMDRVATDCVMLTALTAFYVSEIISLQEALSGFSSPGLLTVLALLSLAEGLNKTGALNWYIGKLLGNPKTVAGAQLRVMVPIAMLSGFINDTPLVTVALPSVIQWARKIQVSPRYLLMPLSFSALLGGVCTLIGTSTNLVVAGLLQERYKDVPEFQNMSLFALGQYGVPVALVGIAYVLLATPWLLARGGKDSAAQVDDMFTDVLLGARLTPWSPAAGRTVQRSGLRDTGGIYLVRVQRASTGNVHPAVGPDFVLQVGDTLYFTGLVETFGEFCAEHGLEVITNEVTVQHHDEQVQSASMTDGPADAEPASSPSVYKDEMGHTIEVYDDNDIGYTIESILEALPQDCMRVIYHMQDAIRGEAHAYKIRSFPVGHKDRVVVTTVDSDLVVVALDTADRSGLMLDISKCLERLQLELQNVEAAVLEGNRSLSIWRCKLLNNVPFGANTDPQGYLTEIWSVIHSLLSTDTGVAALKQRGLRVVRAIVLPKGRLVGTTAAQVDFRQTYKAAIVAIPKSVTSQKKESESLADITLEAGDALVLQVGDGSPILETPPKDFYQKLMADKASSRAPAGLFGFGKSKSTSTDSNDDTNLDTVEIGQGEDIEGRKAKEAVWRDLQVITSSKEGVDKEEFLAAMKVAQGSRLSGRTAVEAGIDKLPDIFLVSVERPVDIAPEAGPSLTSYSAVALSEPLQDGDVLWFSCKSAALVGDLRKIPGLVSYQTEEVEKMDAKIHERRLVQAVVARKGPLVGKTVQDVRFRTQYGAAVIAVQREGRRVHEHPGNIKLQAGDVLLLEAGPSFLADKVQHDRSFVLVAEVKNSAPPRMSMLIPAIVLTVAAYACFVAKLSALIGCVMVAVILMVACGIMSETEARDAIRWDIYLTIASAYGIGTALVNSGVAGAVANFLVHVGNGVGLGRAGLLGAVYLATVLISQLVANNAAAALIFPIAMDAAESTGTDLTLMSYTIMLAASAAFMTPFGYQTNLMVMGPGGYATSDFLIFGTPMQIVLLFATTVFLVAPLWICWLVSFAVFLAAAVYRVSSDLRSLKRLKTS